MARGRPGATVRRRRGGIADSPQLDGPERAGPLRIGYPAKQVRLLTRALGGRAIRTIVQVSDAGRAPKNEPAVLALAIAAGMGHTAAASEALPKVCRTGTHLFAFAEAVQGLRGWGRGLRRGIAGWYEGK